MSRKLQSLPCLPNLFVSKPADQSTAYSTEKEKFSSEFKEIFASLKNEDNLKYRASAKGALAKGDTTSTETNSPYQFFYGNQLFVHVFLGAKAPLGLAHVNVNVNVNVQIKKFEKS